MSNVKSWAISHLSPEYQSQLGEYCAAPLLSDKRALGSNTSNNIQSLSPLPLFPVVCSILFCLKWLTNDSIPLRAKILFCISCKSSWFTSPHDPTSILVSELWTGRLQNLFLSKWILFLSFCFLTFCSLSWQKLDLHFPHFLGTFLG